MTIRLAGLIDALAKARVLCIGDVMLDRFISGRVDRISPEAPIPVFRIQREQSMLGGAGNVVRNLVSLGAHAAFVSVVGKDAAGYDVMRLVGELDRVEPHLLVDPARPTTIKTRFVADSHQLLRADQESDEPLDGETARDIERLIADAVADCDVVVLSDYGKGVLAETTTQTTIAVARKARKPVIVDPKGTNWSRYKGASVLTPNRHELALAGGMATDSAIEIEKAARRQIKALGLSAMLCTRGKDGVSLVRPSGKTVLLPTSAREVFDVSGAGDTVLAAFAAALATGAEMDLASMLANIAAGIVVGKVGTAVVYPDEIKREIVHEANVASEAKIFSAAQGQETIQRWRRHGLRGRVHQRRLRSAASRPRDAAAQGARGLRPAARRGELGRFGQAAEGQGQTAAGRGVTRDGARLAGERRRRRHLRRGLAAGPDPAAAAGSAGQGRGLHARQGRGRA